MKKGQNALRHSVSRMASSAMAFAVVLLAASAPRTMAYREYSVNGGDATNCGACHGNFRAATYVSPVDGMNWGNLHNLHRTTMLNGDCSVCHSGASRLPVILNLSSGGAGLATISCVGCHGRAHDDIPANPEVAAGRSGLGAGLRQHHFAAGTTVCASCHLDADPANYTAVGENVLPPYYASPGTGHPLMPTSSCNDNGSENFAGAPQGLDNNGDSAYDASDVSCNTAGAGGVLAEGALRSLNSPNPFRARTTIEYETSGSAPVEVLILDVQGRLVRRLKPSDPASAHQRVEWDGRDESGTEMPSGVFMYELRSGAGRSRRTMILLR